MPRVSLQFRGRVPEAELEDRVPGLVAERGILVIQASEGAMTTANLELWYATQQLCWRSEPRAQDSSTKLTWGGLQGRGGRHERLETALTQLDLPVTAIRYNCHNRSKICSDMCSHSWDWGFTSWPGNEFGDDEDTL